MGVRYRFTSVDLRWVVSIFAMTTGLVTMIFADPDLVSPTNIAFGLIHFLVGIGVMRVFQTKGEKLAQADDESNDDSTVP